MTIIAKFNGRCANCGRELLAGGFINWDKATRRASHVSAEACNAARAAAPTTPVVDTAKLDLKPIAEFIQAARNRGLKFPKLRVLSPDGREMTLGLTVSGRAPGSVSVKLAGEFIGTVAPDGTPYGRGLSAVLQAHLVKVAAAPAVAAKQYAVATCSCSFCGLRLTDEGSIDVGYGPVCADRWGLPHTPKGTKAAVTVDAGVAAEPKSPMAQAAGDYHDVPTVDVLGYAVDGTATLTPADWGM